MNCIVKTASISTKHLQRASLDVLRKEGLAKKSDGNDFFIQMNDKCSQNWAAYPDLVAIVCFAREMGCEYIRIHDQGVLLPFLMYYNYYPREVDGKNVFLELAYYGTKLVSEKIV